MKTPAQSIAFGALGIEPRWTSSAKDGIGAAFQSTSCGFTLRWQEGWEGNDFQVEIGASVQAQETR